MPVVTAQGLKRVFDNALAGPVFGFLFAAGTVVFLVGVAGVAGAIWHFSKDLRIIRSSGL